MDVQRGSSGVDGYALEGLPLAEAFADVLLDLPDAVVACDEAGRILLANDAVRRLLGHVPKKLTGRPLETVLPRGAASLPRPSEGREMLARHRNGSDVWVELTASRMMESGRAVLVIDMRDAGPRRTVRERLRRGEASLRVVLEGLPDATVGTARDERIVMVNALAEELFGYRREELVGKPVQTLWPERIRDRYTRNMQLYFATEHPLRFSTEAWGLRRDGSEFAGEMSWGIVETEAGKLLLAIGRDVSARRAADRRLRAVAAMGERALAGADPRDLAREAVELMRATLPVAGALVRLGDGTVLAHDGEPSRADVRLGIGNASELVVALDREPADDELAFMRTVANTMTTALERLRGEERMRHEAVHDPLTGLANRTLLRDRLEHALARSEREEEMATGVLFIDLDNFKQVNDAHGHAAGDAVLVELGRRLRTAVRPADTVARLGGDEFVVICEEVDAPTALALGGRLEAAIREPLEVGGITHLLTASIGVALGRTDPDALLGDADAAVYDAKAAGRGRVHLFTPRARPTAGS
jgi:diguanylate cyclase (GGDEF)-like protein/PAS domain S-box-containing protein